jgi:hypothetical protein
MVRSCRLAEIVSKQPAHAICFGLWHSRHFHVAGGLASVASTPLSGLPLGFRPSLDPSPGNR